MHPMLADKLESLHELCRTHRVLRLELFGSAARDDFDPQRSDLDFLVEFAPQPRKGFGDVFFQLHRDLERLFGRPVDLVERHVIERSENYIRRRSILNSAVPLYDAA